MRVLLSVLRVNLSLEALTIDWTAGAVRSSSIDASPA
jgi:hypothetical protein